MAALFLVREEQPGSADAALDAARRQLTDHGFGECAERVVPGWRIVHAPYIIGGPTLVAEAGADFVLAAGTLAYDGRVGLDALRALLADSPLPQPDLARLTGHFAVLLHRQGRTFLIGDFFATFPIYHDAEMRVFSTSFLAAAAALPLVTLDPQGVYEFAFQASVLGDDTVLREVKQLAPTSIVELTPDGTIRHQVSRRLPEAPVDMPLEARIERHAGLLKQVVAEQVKHFGDNVQCPLSGGLDSRLVLATLRALGCRPHVYVYGSPNSEDVSIGRAIGRAEGFEVEWIDKDSLCRISPDAFPAVVARNFHENDGVPQFGGIFDAGGNSLARNARHRAGALAVSGGCGEVFRNFFYLPDRRLSARDVTHSFFTRFDQRDTTGDFKAERYVRRIGDKLLEAVERPDHRGPLPRTFAEQMYPRVRGRSGFGREISVDARYSPYLLPFLDHRVVTEALTLPLGLKAAGRFEALLLAAIDPALARRPSAYGHDFAGPPSVRHRLEEWSARVRPIWLRRRSYAIQRRLRPLADDHGGLLGPDFMRRVVDLEFPVMRRFFRMENIRDQGLWRRIANLEYFAAHLGSRLASD